MSSDHATAAQRRLSAAEVPPGWTTIRLGDVFEQVVDRGHTRELPVLSVTMDEGVVRRDSLDRRNDREVDREDYLRVQPGDIAYNTMRMWQGASGLVREEGYVSPAYTVVRASPEESPEFWAHYFKHPATIRDFLDHSQGFAKDRYRLYFKHFASVPALRPPLAEQRKIAAAVSSVDLAIDATTAVADHLHRVERGVAEAGLQRLTDSPRAPLHACAVIQTGIAKNKSLSGTVTLPYLRVANVQAGHFDLSEMKEISVPEDYVEAYRVRPGDVLLTEGGDLDKLGRGAVWAGQIDPCLHQNHVFCVRVDRSRLEPSFLALLTDSVEGRDYFLTAAKQTTNLASINKTQLGGLPCLLPPVSEQRRLLSKVDSVRSAANIHRERLAALRRLRVGLMGELLSGRRRVSPESVPVPA